MLFIFVAYIILCLYKVKLIPCKEKTYFSDYMSKDKSHLSKGFLYCLCFSAILIPMYHLQVHLIWCM